MTFNFKRRSKYNAKKTLIDGVLFSSQKEGRRYVVLKALAAAGKIKNLQIQPEFVLQYSFKDYSGKTHRPITYIADFKYENENGQQIIEDTKGFKTEIYRLKKKLLLRQIPHGTIFLES